MRRLTILLLAVITLTCWSCKSVKKTSTTVVPEAPVYSDTSQWYIVDRQAPVDLFYIVSTETGDYTINGLPCHFADTYNDSIRQFLEGEMVGVDKILTHPAPPQPSSPEGRGNLNFFSPYYRQCTLQSFTSEETMQSRLPLALDDVRKAFAYYLAHFNNNRPFIMAGFSQGAIAVIDLLKQMDSATYSRMVAAYVIGWRITDDDLSQTNHIRPAKDSTDLGVTVCYNSVRDNSCAIPMLSEGNRMAINPVNWHTDATPATLVSPISSDTVTVTLDTSTLLLNVDGYSRTDYVLPLIGREGNYHSLEISLYRHCLRHNVALRAGRFIAER